MTGRRRRRTYIALDLFTPDIPPSGENIRILQTSDTRITQSGDRRITW